MLQREITKLEKRFGSIEDFPNNVLLHMKDLCILHDGDYVKVHRETIESELKKRGLNND